MKLHFAALALFASAISSSAMAEVITFDSLANSGAGLTAVTSHTEAGFAVTGPMATIGAGFGGAYAGSASLFLGNPGNVATLTRVDGSAFNLSAIDLSPLAVSWYGGGAQVTFTGHRQDGATVEQSFEVGAEMGFATYTFTNFSNLSSVTWTQVENYHQFDNIVATASSADVPEPGALALFGIALAAVGAVRRKARKA